MRKAEFSVPSELMAQFAEEMAKRNFNNTITGATEEGEMLVEVSYERDEADEVDEVEDALEKIRENLEKEREKEEEEEENEK